MNESGREAVVVIVDHSQGLLERFLERATDAHYFADGFH
jgi:hypothetical protein